MNVFDVNASQELTLDWDELLEPTPEVTLIEGESHSIADAFIKSLNTYGRVDIEYISELSGEDKKTVISSLEATGSIFQNPETWQECYYLGFETADEYLSGNILKKINAAKEANKTHDNYFARNVAALKKVLPKRASAEEIYVTLGSPWLPAKYIDQFLVHLFGKAESYYARASDMHTKHDPITGSWDIPFKGRYDYSSKRMAVYFNWGTRFVGALELIELALNQKAPTVYDTRHTRVDGKNKTEKIINRTETMLAQEKQAMLIEEFSQWILSAPARKKHIEEIYFEKYGSTLIRHFNGGFLEFPDLNPKIRLYSYQKNAVARILFSRNTLLAHDVGAGKTYIMAASGHELRRMGISKKNMYVVPNNLTGQWHDAFLELYPNSDLLMVTPSSFKPNVRQQMLARIRDEEHDAIIIAYSCFDMLPLSREYLLREAEAEREKLVAAAADGENNTSLLKRRARTAEEDVKRLADPNFNATKPKRKKRAEGSEELSPEQRLAEQEEKIEEIGICFDELGINTLFVDEAHNYKNIKIDTTIQMLGIANHDSQKCERMMGKVRCVQKQNGGRGVVFATGTPITNSVSDVYTMQKYLQNGELELLELESFNAWVGMFAERHTDFEVDVDATNFRMATRLSKFYNLPELTALFASVTDFHKVDKTNDIPECGDRINVLIPKTPELADYLGTITYRCEQVRSRHVSAKADNLLLITVDGRKAALDIRLVKPASPFTTSSKVFRCAERVARVYFKTQKERCAQLVFCDISTPNGGGGFNMYTELRQLLITMGVHDEEIAFIHDYDTERKRDSLFAAVNAGDIRVLVGSTSKLGLGVNVQERLVALHHLSVPWRPADMAQREGRILRQGNTCPKVEIYRYITEGSFDSYIWQMLESKQSFIEELLAGFIDTRSADDVGDVSLDYGEIKALAVGDLRIKERIVCANTLAKFKLLMVKDAENRENMRLELAKLPNQKEKQQKIIDKTTLDVAFIAEDKDEIPKEERLKIRDEIAEGLRLGELLTEEKVLMCYRGFDIVIPAGMQRSSPYIWLRREGSYYLELGEGDRGHIVRIDNLLDGLSDLLKRQKDGLTQLRRREKSIREQLKKENDYSEQVEKYRSKLERLDRELGVKM